MVMKKIYPVFVHGLDENGMPAQIADVPNPLTSWVFETNEDGSYQGVATKMYDGLACYVNARGQLFKKVVIPPGKTPPTNFLPAEPFRVPSQVEFGKKMPQFTGRTIDRVGEWNGWVPVTQADVLHTEAWQIAMNSHEYTPGVGNTRRGTLRMGTYELIGPEVKGNPEDVFAHTLVKHGDVQYPHCPRDFYGLKDFIDDMGIHGIMFHRSPGSAPGINEMAKVTHADFGLIRRSPNDMRIHRG